MAKYKLLEAAFIQEVNSAGPCLCTEGQTVTVSDDTIPGAHMQPLDAAARKASAGMELISNPHTRGGHTDADFGASPQDIPSGFATGLSPFSPESFGCSAQRIDDGFSALAWGQRSDYRRLASICINKCSPMHVSITQGCLLPIQRNPATGEFKGEASRCKVLCDGQRCEALESLNPQLRNLEPEVA